MKLSIQGINLIKKVSIKNYYYFVDDGFLIRKPTDVIGYNGAFSNDINANGFTIYNSKTFGSH